MVHNKKLGGKRKTCKKGGSNYVLDNYGNANHSWITSEQQVKSSLSKSHTEK